MICILSDLSSFSIGSHAYKASTLSVAICGTHSRLTEKCKRHPSSPWAKLRPGSILTIYYCLTVAMQKRNAFQPFWTITILEHDKRSLQHAVVANETPPNLLVHCAVDSKNHQCLVFAIHVPPVRLHRTVHLLKTDVFRCLDGRYGSSGCCLRRNPRSSGGKSICFASSSGRRPRLVSAPRFIDKDSSLLRDELRVHNVDIQGLSAADSQCTFTSHFLHEDDGSIDGGARKLSREDA
ncbi:hypothetical protein KC337_g99 [Hortaea werneckii]|nr:hypothetical protein KC337_g99 [Hortaea werneckii]